MVNFRDYRLVLKAELERRRSRNASYSLRAFARDLELSPSRLSRVLNGKEALSRPRAERIGGKLGFQKDQIELFCDLVDVEHASTESEQALARARVAASKASLLLD